MCQNLAATISWQCFAVDLITIQFAGISEVDRPYPQEGSADEENIKASIFHFVFRPSWPSWPSWFGAKGLVKYSSITCGEGEQATMMAAGTGAHGAHDSSAVHTPSCRLGSTRRPGKGQDWMDDDGCVKCFLLLSLGMYTSTSADV